MKSSYLAYPVLIFFLLLFAHDKQLGFFIFTSIILFITLLYHLAKNKYTPDKIILIAILTTLACIGRVLFAFLPSIQLASFVIILSGIVFGPSIAFITGLLTPIMSNFFQGQGLWTIWQMFSFGIMGLFSGLFAKSLKQNKIWRAFFGMLAGIIFGWIMNLMTVIYVGGGKFYISNIIPIYTMSLFFDVLHGTTNALLLFIIGDMCIKKLEMLKSKIQL